MNSCSTERASIESHGAHFFSLRARVFFHYRGLGSSHCARAIPHDHAALRSMASSNGRDERGRGNPGRFRSLFSCDAGGRGLEPDRVVARSLPGKHSCHLDRHGHWRPCPTNLDALGEAALPAPVHWVGLPRLFTPLQHLTSVNLEPLGWVRHTKATLPHGLPLASF